MALHSPDPGLKHSRRCVILPWNDYSSVISCSLRVYTSHFWLLHERFKLSDSGHLSSASIFVCQTSRVSLCLSFYRRLYCTVCVLDCLSLYWTHCDMRACLCVSAHACTSISRCACVQAHSTSLYVYIWHVCACLNVCVSVCWCVSVRLKTVFVHRRPFCSTLGECFLFNRSPFISCLYS